MDSINIPKDSISSQLKDSVSISKDSIDSTGSFSKEDWQAIAVVEAIVIVIAIIVIFILTRIRKGNSQNKSAAADTSAGNSYNPTAQGHNIDNNSKSQNEVNKQSEGTLTSEVTNSKQQSVSTKETTDTTQKSATKDNSVPTSLCKETNSSTDNTKLESPAATQSVPSKKTPTTLPPTIKTLYAPYPRSSNDGITYFADLTENYNEEDSRFELMVFDNGTKAEFLPLNFIDIRNSDDAMSVINTEGEKPKDATTVVGKTHGKAHKDGEMWIVDEPAKLKLK